MSDRRFCPLSFAHPAHDSCDGTPFDAMAEIAKLESKVDALMREKEELLEHVQGLVAAIGHMRAAIAPATERTYFPGLQGILSRANDAIRALVREQQNTTQEDLSDG